MPLRLLSASLLLLTLLPLTAHAVKVPIPRQSRRQILKALPPSEEQTRRNAFTKNLPTKKSDLAELGTYENYVLGLHFTYPSAWVSGMQLTMGSQSRSLPTIVSADRTASFAMATLTTPRTASPERLLELATLLFMPDPKAVPLGTLTPIQVGPYSGFAATYGTDGSGEQGRIIVIPTDTGRGYAMFIKGDSAAAYTAAQEAIDHVVGSFRMLHKGSSSQSSKGRTRR